MNVLFRLPEGWYTHTKKGGKKYTTRVMFKKTDNGEKHQWDFEYYKIVYPTMYKRKRAKFNVWGNYGNKWLGDFDTFNDARHFIIMDILLGHPALAKEQT